LCEDFLGRSRRPGKCRMKTRIQYLEFRIQKERASGVVAWPSTKPRSNTDSEKTLNTEQRARVNREPIYSRREEPAPDEGGGGKRRPTPKAFEAGLAWTKRCLEPWSGAAGYRNAVNRVGEFTGSCHRATASCRLIFKFYCLAAASCRFIWKFYRFLPHQSTQVVDFPRMAMVRHFWGQREMLATDETQIKHGCQAELGSPSGRAPWETELV
jgi:hypothetical protein